MVRKLDLSMPAKLSGMQRRALAAPAPYSIPEIVDAVEEMTRIRRELHAHPELGHDVAWTADRIAQCLTQWGLEVTRGVGGAGLVGTLRNGSGTRIIGLRADMDALPINEVNGLAHQSTVPGRMHACGHDGHMAMLLAAARYLAVHRHFDGVVHFIFQPAEETGDGARRMIDDGLFERFPVDAIFGIHNWPDLDTGVFGVRSGPLMASSNHFVIDVQGMGAHAAMPHEGRDPVFTAVQIFNALQGIVTRDKAPIDTAALSITTFHAGETFSIVPDRARFGGTIRTFDGKTLDLIERRMRDICAGFSNAFGCVVTLDFRRRVPPTCNDIDLSQLAIEVIQDTFGKDFLDRDTPPTMAAEDFSEMLRHVPGCFVFLGNGDGAHRGVKVATGPCSLHNPAYDFNDALLPIGSTYYVRLVERFLRVDRTP